MSKEDYFKYYIQGSDHYLIPKDIFNELYNELECWRDTCKKNQAVLSEIKSILEKGDFEDGCDCIIIEELIEKYEKEK